MDGGSSGSSSQSRLDSWKEIGAFFGRDERTVKRWERERGLPVHRLPGSGRGRVYAYPAELTEWLQGAEVDAEADVDTDPVPNTLAEPDLPRQSPSSYHPIGFAPSGDSAARVPEPSPRLSLVHSNARPATSPAAAVQPQSAQASAASPAAASATPQPPSSQPASPPPPVPLVVPPASPSRQFLAACAVGVIALGCCGLAWRSYQHRQFVQAATTPQSVAASSANQQAQDLYLQGKFYWQQRTPDSLTKAVDLFTQAIVHDPHYAPAYAGLAECYELLREFSNMPDKEAFPRALSAAQQAVTLDPNLAQGHSALAFALYWWSWDTQQALRQYELAIQLDPASAQAHHWYATTLMSLGRGDEALRQIDEAQRLDPGSRAIVADKGLILADSGHPDEARALLQQLEQTDPQFPSPHNYLAGLAEREGDGPAYVRETRAAAALQHDAARQHLADLAEAAYQQGGAKAMRAAIDQNTRDLYKQGKAGPARMAHVLASEGEVNEAFRILDQAYTQRDPDTRGLLDDSVWQPYRSDPRFVAIQKKLGAE
jgi:tetratricopeptide (TPR) repeat protein